MDDSKKAIQNIKQALRQLATNGVPVGNMIEAMKEIEEKYAESDDEKIRKALTNWFKECHWDAIDDGKLKKEDIIAWLEKQKEHKIVNLSELNWEDILTLQDIINEVHSEYPCGISAQGFGEEVIERFIEQKKDRFKKQKPEWSEEDSVILDALIRRLEGEDIVVSKHLAIKCLKSLRPQLKQEWSEEQEGEIAILKGYISSGEWSKSHISRALGIIDNLRPQKQWKPSEEQLNALELAACQIDLYDYQDVLSGLLEQLKAL